MTTEIRAAFRRLLQTPTFTLVAILTLALGLGANTAIFSVVEAVLLRPLAYPEPERLVMVWQDFTGRGGPAKEWFSPGNFLDWRDQNESLEGMGVFAGWAPTRTGSGSAERLVGAAVSHEMFRVLGAEPERGRGFSAEEELVQDPGVVVVTHDFWQRRLGGTDDAVGRRIELDGEPHAVVGVLPDGFEFPVNGGEIFRPLFLDPADAPRGAIYIRSIGRLKEGVSIAQAQEDLAAVAQRLEEAHPRANAGVGALVTPLRDELVGDLRPALLALLGAVGLVLLIACVNLSGLLLVRTEGRGRERAVRRALGAGSLHLAAGPLLEALMLTLAGGAAGLLLAFWLLEGLRALTPIELPPAFEPTVDGTVLAFAAALAVVTALVSGLVPTWTERFRDLHLALREGSAGTGQGRRGKRTRALLVVGELALALTLLLGSGLLLRSFLQVQAVDPGFEPDRLLTFRVAPPPSGYPEDAQVRDFHGRYLERLGALPGVEAAALVSWAPMSGGDTDISFVLEGEPAPEPGREKVIWYRQASPGYFDTAGIRIRAGRTFTAGDGPEAPRVVVLGEAAARRFFPDGDAVGRRLKPGDDPASDEPWWTVVGVVESVRHDGLDADPKAEMYLAHAQAPRRGMTVVLRTSGDPEAVLPSARAALAAIDPSVALGAVATGDELVAGSTALPRFLALCILAFGVVALLLAALGVYGVIAQTVGRRAPELGLRMALGADRGALLRLVMRQGALLAVAGLALGLVGGALASRLIRGLLFEVAPGDPGAWLAAVVVFAAVALLATWLPARRATRLDPLTALRQE